MDTDILILGAGCAGLSAGLYAARAGFRVTILERNVPGGQAALTSRVENYPGILETDGFTLMQTMLRQAEAAGAKIISCAVRSADLREKRVLTDQGEYRGRAIIIAAGAEPKTLGIPGEEDFRGRGVSYCATCDGFFYRDKDIYVIGGGNSAGEEALHLAELGRSVTMLVRRDTLRCQDIIRKKLEAHSKIRVELNREAAEIAGQGTPEQLKLRNTVSGEVETRQLEPGTGIFIFAGYRPATRMFADQLALDEAGYIPTDGQLCTGIPGVFAAGDIRQKRLRQIITAAADGAVAASEAAEYLLGNP